jgi:hypothetical protein
VLTSHAIGLSSMAAQGQDIGAGQERLLDTEVDCGLRN